VWALGDPQGRITQAVVTEVLAAANLSGAQRTIVMAAASGRVVRFPFNSFNMSWRYTNPAVEPHGCHRQGCEVPAFFRHQANGMTHWWCHAHIPSPEHTLLPGEGEEIRRDFAPCPSCGEFSENQDTHAWRCSACHMRARIFEHPDIQGSVGDPFSAFRGTYFGSPELIYAGRGIRLGGFVLQEATVEPAGHVLGGVPIYNTSDPAWEGKWLVCSGGAQNRQNVQHMGGTPREGVPAPSNVTVPGMPEVGTTWWAGSQRESMYIVRMVMPDVERISFAPITNPMQTIPVDLETFRNEYQPAPLVGSRWLQIAGEEASVTITDVRTVRNRVHVTAEFEDGEFESMDLFSFASLWRHQESPHVVVETQPFTETIPEPPQREFDILEGSLWRSKASGLVRVIGYNEATVTVSYQSIGATMVLSMSARRLTDNYTQEMDDLPDELELDDLWLAPGEKNDFKVVSIDREGKVVELRPNREGIPEASIPTVYAAPSHLKEWRRIVIPSQFDRILDDAGDDW